MKKELAATPSAQGRRTTGKTAAETPRAGTPHREPGEHHAASADAPECEALRQALSSILLDLARVVAPEDFCTFVYLAAHGGIRPAARVLGLGRSTLFERVESWATRGPAYARMRHLVPCRNHGVPMQVVPLGASAASGEGGDQAEAPEVIAAMLDQIQSAADAQRDYPAVLRDMKDALQAMGTSGNYFTQPS
jgi:hypothetical protein